MCCGRAAARARTLNGDYQFRDGAQRVEPISVRLACGRPSLFEHLQRIEQRIVRYLENQIRYRGGGS